MLTFNSGRLSAALSIKHSYLEVITDFHTDEDVTLSNRAWFPDNFPMAQYLVKELFSYLPTDVKNGPVLWTRPPTEFELYQAHSDSSDNSTLATL